MDAINKYTAIPTKQDLKYNPKKFMGKKTIAPPVNALINTKNKRENLDCLDRWMADWDSLADVRRRARRSRDFAQGKQWSDPIYDTETKQWMTEEYYLRTHGRQPLVENIIQPILNNLNGQFLNNETQIIVSSRTDEHQRESEIMSNAIQSVHQTNQSDVLDSQLYEMYSLTGVAIQKLRFKYIKEANRKDVFYENCNIHRMFFNADINDPRGIDIIRIGQLMDFGNIDEIISSFAQTREDEEKIKYWYSDVSKTSFIRSKGFSTDDIDNLSFLIAPINKFRVIEGWELRSAWRVFAHDEMVGKEDIVDYTLEELEAINQKRIKVYKENNIDPSQWLLINAYQIKEQFWYGKYLTPYGETLWEGESPFEHQEHPFVITCANLIDGKVKGFVEDLISPQKSINRNMMLQDLIISGTAKGALFCPIDIIPEGESPEEWSDKWGQVGSTFFYVPKPHGKIPEEVSAKSTNIGIYEILASQLKFVQDISGVQSAIQGKAPVSGTPSSLYAQQAQNSTLNTLRHMTIFEKHLEKRDYKTLKMIMQFYDTPRYISIVGSRYKADVKKYVPEEIRQLEFDLVRSKSVNTPVYRQMVNDELFKLLQLGAITPEIYLENSNFPFADKILDTVNKAKEALQQGQQLPNGQIQEVMQNANPQAMAMLNQ